MQSNRLKNLSGENGTMADVRILDEHIEGLTHTYRVSLNASRVAEAVDIKLKEIGHKACIPGFRPGRAPLPLVRNHHGDRVREAVIDRMAIRVTRTLIVEKSLEPTRRPKIHIEQEEAASSGEVLFSLLVEVPPKVEIGPLEGFRLRQLRVPEGDTVLAERANADLRRQLFDRLMERYDFPVPKDMVENEYERIVHGFEAEVGEAVDTQLAVEMRGIAERRIRLAILLIEIGRVHNIRIPREEVEALVERQAERDPAHQAEIIDYYLDHPTALAELQSPLFEDRVVAFLLKRSEIEEVELSNEELRKALAHA